MSQSSIIEVQNLSKKYEICHERQAPYASLKETLTNLAKHSVRKLLGCSSNQELSQNNKEEFWALKPMDLQIQEGDRIAIMGRNGAGKSTFLKLISRITEPTTGVIKVRGRVASLLEVGTGFHPDLTGRENILLNGAIMGMSYDEMKKKFDEIVAFAEIEKFLDTPIKRYSSGMYMRLGFAVAAHLDADLLIVDEVLAVGDAQFQEKCIKKMNEMGSKGGTLLFVSHSIQSVLSLCNKGILLEKGELKAFEPIEQCIGRYIQSGPVSGMEWQGQAGDENIQLFRAALHQPSSDTTFFYQDERTHLQLNFEVVKPHPDLAVGFSILNSRHQVVARSRFCERENRQQVRMDAGQHYVTFDIDLSMFHPGEYQLRVDSAILNRKRILHEEIILQFAICSREEQAKNELGGDKDGISLGNRWTLHAPQASSVDKYILNPEKQMAISS